VFFVAIPLASAQDIAAIGPSGLDLVKAAEADRIRAIDSVYGAVVAIYGNDRQGGGSGVLFDSSGYALTNHHVVAAAGDEGWAGLADGNLYRWKLIGTDPGGDVAIIKLSGQEKFPAAPLGNSDRVRVGDWAMAMGNPFALAEDQRPTVTLGIVSGVNRFQEGSGLNQLVYGNCIQVDSSINPGNSGGPLFNLAGQIIGINGRGSFEERGRVNVGLGYAISANQIKHFIPELLATKIAQHGTLDAVFGNRQEGVICYTINTASPAARAGLALGDKLLSFEGTPITDANQLTNLVSTYPAGWPVELTFERDGQAKTIRVRLTPLPYESRVPPPRRDEQPPEKPAEPMPEKAPQPQVKKERPELPLSDAGKIRDTKLNQAVAREILDRWRLTAAAPRTSTFRIESEIRRADQKVGDQVLALSPGGNIHVEYSIDGNGTIVACNDKECWRILPGRERQVISRGKALLDPHFAQAVSLAALLDINPLTAWGDLALDGSDKAGGQLCYRLSLTDPGSSEQLFIWLSVFDIGGRLQVRLVKTGVGLADDEPVAATIYGFNRTMEGLFRERRLVQGLAEMPDLTIITRDFAASADLDLPFVPSLATPFSTAIDFAQKRTVKIFGAGIGRNPGYATGILVSSQGEILTAQGAFLSGDNLRVTSPDGKTHLANVVRRSHELQTALLKIDAPTPDYFDLSNQAAAAPGDWILAISNAFKVADRNEPLSASIGVVSSRMPLDARRGVQDFPYHADALLYDAITANPGAEGGAVVAAEGRLLGMIGRTIESSSTGTRLNYAVPADLLAHFLAAQEPPPPAVAAESSAKADLGIRLFALGGRRGPAYIDRVLPGSPAAAAGLKSDDLVVTIAGQVVRDTSDFKKFVESLSIGQEVVVEVKRKNELLSVRITPVAER
jgi:S1-C subfamily serine protease